MGGWGGQSTGEKSKVTRVSRSSPNLFPFLACRSFSKSAAARTLQPAQLVLQRTMRESSAVRRARSCLRVSDEGGFE